VFQRDLKPSNVMLDSKRNIVVIDFGIATQVGTIQWQLQGYTKRSEFFALAMNIMALITGKEPFETAEKWLNCEVPARETYEKKSFPWTIHPLMKKCLSEKPEHRPSSIYEIFDEISFARILCFKNVNEHERD